MAKRVKKWFNIDVTTANVITSKTFEFDKNVVAIHGVLLTSDRDDLLYYRGSAKIEINSDEVFPEGYEAKLLVSGLNVSPNDRYCNIGGLPPGNFKVKVDYKDTPDARLPFVNYRVTIYFDLEIKS
jgi:hypothetical protein